MKKILIVDDSKFMRNVIKELLSSKNADTGIIHDLEFCEADGKSKAVKELEKNKPDAILLDIVMQESEMEGVEFIQEVQSFFDTNKIIVISSIGQPEIIDQCKKLGIIFYIQKPIEHTEIIEAVNRVLR